ncbi:MAG: hypothetical protein HC840_24750 [Leptolyngbyaceae cyanobacterium RM2_2_4]|nr:hypothetical protein [Leptolyngbyaceae cyanobacterium SM1_4_3]NJN56877.1 hypothetical protein [Leptolyngbyaceae cyanobacterium SL_5_9]NJO52084.1 hypothetical protein [Leptolyngbyaceae cyanobacterium RM2_2_4]
MRKKLIQAAAITFLLHLLMGVSASRVTQTAPGASTLDLSPHTAEFPREEEPLGMQN